jgi:hypothetical protein
MFLLLLSLWLTLSFYWLAQEVVLAITIHQSTLAAADYTSSNPFPKRVPVRGIIMVVLPGIM